MIQTKRGLTLEAFSSGIIPIKDIKGELQWAEGLGFATGYPGGDLDGLFTVPRNIVAWWEINGAKRIAFRQGQKMVYEGYVSALDRLLDEQRQSIRMPCVGGWAHILMNRRWRKYWADNRYEEKIWPIMPLSGTTKPEKYNFDRTSKLKIYPKGLAFVANEFGILGYYILPTGSTIKRITFDYDFQEAAQNWNAKLIDTTNLTDLWTISASGTGTQDITLATPSALISFQLYSGATQTAPGDETIYLTITNLVVYTETGAINPTEIAKDIIGHFSDLNSYTGAVGNNTLSIVPFLAEWDENLADVITRAVSFGDIYNYRWSAFLLNSENAQIPDGKPILGIEKTPVLTDYDLVLRLDEDNVAGQVQISQIFDSVYNWIVVEYQDENGWPHWITPDDDATLKDTASIAVYGQHDYLLKLDYSTSSVATSIAKRFLSTNKDPQWNSSPIGVIDHIQRKDGYPTPVAQIRAGQRLRIENFIQDLSGTGLTLMITSTRYEDETGTCQMTFGQPESPLLTELSR